MVIQDWRGAIIRALSMHVPLPQTIVEVESLACRQIVIFVVETGLHEVVFEGNVVVVIQAIKSGSVKHSSYGHIIDDIIHHSSQLSFFFFFFRYVNRSCNKIVNVLEKKAKAGVELQVWLEEISREIALLVFSDVP